MRKNLFIFIVLFGCTLCSCTEDNRTLQLAYPNCLACNGTGYVETSEYFGLKTIYRDCFLCKQRLSSQQGNTGGDVSFRGNDDYKYGSCNSGCGCQSYSSSPTSAGCVNCEYYGCTRNNFAHRRLSN